MKDKILKLRREGKTYKEITNLLKCSKSTVSYHCNKNNIKVYIENIDKILQNDVINYRKNGLKLNEIYNILNKKITKENIRIICNKNNLSYLDRLSEDDIKNIRNEFKKLGKYKKVSRLLGYTFNTIKKYTSDLNEYKKGKTLTNSESVINWRKRVKIKLVEYKGGKCEICGYNKYVEVLEFHHKDTKEKDFTISGKSWSYERLKKEVDKCIIVCSNCHKEIHLKEENEIFLSSSVG